MIFAPEGGGTLTFWLPGSHLGYPAQEPTTASVVLIGV